MKRAMVQTATPQWVLNAVRNTVQQAVDSIIEDAVTDGPRIFQVGPSKLQDRAFMSSLIAKTVQTAMKEGHHFDIGALRSLGLEFPDHAPDLALITVIKFDDTPDTTNVEILYDVYRSVADIHARAEVVTPERWGPGPWVGEPNEVTWHHAGFNCLMRRNPKAGHWNAYVGLPEGHPWFRLQPNDIRPRPPTHREIDFAGAITDDPPGLWWIGFSCTNPTDLMPWHADIPDLMNNRLFRYPKLQYVREQTELLASCAHVAAVRHRGAVEAGHGHFGASMLAHAFRSSWDPEIVICAAVVSSCGRVIRCHRHHDGLRTLSVMGLQPLEAPGQQGFVTSCNRYVDRHEAMRLQRAAGIESVAEGGYRGSSLFSEDLY